MAVKYRDGFGVYAWHGRRIPQTHAWLIEQPEKITATSIDEEHNAEMRRIMLERLGMERYIEQGRLQPFAVDDYGELFRKEMPDEDEPWLLLRVANMTQERDGGFRQYILRVPPDVQTPHQAVAWTFGVKQAEYQPIEES